MAWVLAASVAIANGITIDGQTPTSISSAPGGATQVKIAPANAKGHSRNTYSNFNVTSAGAVLDNSTAGASLILNEVTSKAFSRIEGQLSVSGRRADVVIANPNGILVNGGRFVNTGRTLLVAGARAGSDGSGLPRYRLSDGQVTIGAGGVYAQTGSLHLAAPKLQIDGPVMAAADGDVELLAGRGLLTVGATGENSWLSHAQSGAGGRILLSSGASLSGGAITLQAFGPSSHIELAGISLAQAGNFVLTSDGTVKVKGRVQASETVSLNAKTLSAGVAGTRSYFTSTTQDVQMRASGDLEVRNASFSGAGQGFFGFDTQASLALFADGNLSVSDATFKTTSGYIEATSGKKLSFGSVQADAATDILLASKAGIDAISSTLTAGEAIFATNDSGVLKLERTSALAKLGIVLKSADLEMLSSAQSRSRIVSETAGVVLQAIGNITNAGVLVQGVRAIESEIESTEAITVRAGGDLHLSSLSEVSIGAFYGKDAAIDVSAGGDITNASGRFLADTHLTLKAGGTLTNTVAEVGEDVEGLTLPPEGYVSFGNFKAGREIGQITAKEAITLRAAHIKNTGGEITGKDVSLFARIVLTQPERFGWQNYRKVCFLFIFCKRSASGQILHDGGTITATGQLTIKASQKFTFNGAALSGAKGVYIEAPDIALNAFRFYEFFERRAGLAALFRGKHAVRVANYTTGTIVSEDGEVELISIRPVYDENTEIAALNGVKAPAGFTQLGFAESISKLNERRWGIFRFMTKGSRK